MANRKIKAIFFAGSIDPLRRRSVGVLEKVPVNANKPNRVSIHKAACRRIGDRELTGDAVSVLFCD